MYLAVHVLYQLETSEILKQLLSTVYALCPSRVGINLLLRWDIFAILEIFMIRYSLKMAVHNLCLEDGTKY